MGLQARWTRLSPANRTTQIQVNSVPVDHVSRAVLTLRSLPRMGRFCPERMIPFLKVGAKITFQFNSCFRTDQFSPRRTNSAKIERD